MKRNALFAIVIGLSFLVAVFTTDIIGYASPDQYVSYIIKGDSMRPTLEVNDWITVKSDIDVSHIYAAPWPDGDIIVFYAPQTNSSDTPLIYAHRAIEKMTNNQTGITFLRTKGDNNAAPNNFAADYRGENYSWNGMISEKLLIGNVVGISKPSSAGSWNGVAYNVTTYTNSTVTEPDFSQSDKKIQFDITGYTSYSNNGFCNVTIPKALLNCSSLTDWQVKLNGTSITYTAGENETYTFVYFTYGYSIHHIQIIGTQSISEHQTDSSSQWITVAVVVVAAILLGSMLYLVKRRKKDARQESKSVR
jgi:LPXTG-motif cell wall-anchored protein